MAFNTWMPLYTRDILAGCVEMSATQFGAYCRMLFYAWDSGGLPNDMEACCRIAGGLSPADWQVVRRRLVVLDAGTSEERLSHPRLEAERVRAAGLHAKRCEAMAKARARNSKNGADQSIDQSIDQSPDQSIDQSSDQSLDLKIDTQPQAQSQPHDKKESPSEIPAASRKPRRSRTYRIGWCEEGGFTGISDDDIARWKAAYPAVDLTVETAKAHSWLVDHPAKAKRSNYGQFLGGWFSRCQDRGGTRGAQPAAVRSFRADAGRDMTAGEYAAWKQARDRDEYVRSKARKRGVTQIGDVIDGRGTT
jgi:uncharacterized protein YdaU (DUF1376 family)